MSHDQRKGFTLVELMIVIAIIGILAATLLPTLTGGQARARDTARKSSLQQIAAGLETFYQDRAFYPYLTGWTADANANIGQGTGCLSDTGGNSAPYLDDIMKGGNVPMDPQPTTLVNLCGKTKVYGYWPMQNRGSDNAAFALVANVETYQNANSASGSNMTGTVMPVTYSSGTTGTGFFIPNTKVPSTTTDANSVFFLIQG